MRILLASSEIHPYSKTGGLADMVGALGKALARQGHEVGLVAPLYRGVRERFGDIQRLDWWLEVPWGEGRQGGQVYYREPEKHLTIYLIDRPDLFDRGGIYTEHGQGYADNPERYLFFSKAVVHLANYLPWRPEVLHLHDWQTALAAPLVHHQRQQGAPVNLPGTLLTIHNLAYQGICDARLFALTNLPPAYWWPDGCEFYGAFNFLKGGIEYADWLTTVSPRYAREITTEAFGCQLDGVLRRRAGQLTGILNGVDYEEWNTENNPHLPHPYSWRNLAGKAANKRALQREMGLPERANVPLYGNISRLVDQKGTDLLLGALEEMLATDIQFVFLGSGEPVLEAACRRLAARYPQQVAVRIGFDQPLSHRIEAGCDFYLMPSRFEPCGLNQMYSLRYGTVPIVRRTGGLDDSVVDYLDDPRRANGIKFQEYSSRALARAMRKSLALYAEPALLRRYRINGMKADFSWDRTAREYVALYQKLAG
ncbi:MAG: glycogen synthase GlgA [Verrucomicrobiae bacterium]|nr:glycogen synthase GlgA [Verrucomicrobiae bacterium]